MNIQTEVLQARGWMYRYLRKLGFKKAKSHPSHHCFELAAEPNRKHGNVWITSYVSLYRFEGKSIELVIHGNRCGPEARSTCDGPIEIDTAFGPNISIKWPVFGKREVEELHSIIIEHANKLIVAHEEQVKQFTE